MLRVKPGFWRTMNSIIQKAGFPGRLYRKGSFPFKDTVLKGSNTSFLHLLGHADQFQSHQSIAQGFLLKFS